ncbi:MAG: hypothetical protein P8173_06280 [Gammaproteobacteria bacterium]|jgi:hypothetical protein
MRKSINLLLSAFLLILANFAMAAPGQPSFMPALYGDGQVWGTKGTTPLPAPNENNVQSFDNLYVITNANDPNTVQLPVSEAAPGNPNYNGGRWSVQNVAWTASGFLAYGGYAPILTSEEEIKYNEGLGYLEITSGSTYFQCPLLPVK